MPQFVANLTMLFTELPFLERFAAARTAGFRHVEFPFPYAYEKNRLRDLLERNGLAQVLFALPAGSWGRGERGIAADPIRTAEFRRGVDRAVDYAKALGVMRLSCFAGMAPPNFSAAEANETLVANITHAADVLAGHGRSLLIETINRAEAPGFLLHRPDQAEAILDAVDRPNVAILYDVYQAQAEGEDPAVSLADHIDHIGYVHIADAPGRHQPGTGGIDFPLLLAEIDRLGYDGAIGLNYQPDPDTAASLAWLADLGLSL